MSLQDLDMTHLHAKTQRPPIWGSIFIIFFRFPLLFKSCWNLYSYFYLTFPSLSLLFVLHFPNFLVFYFSFNASFPFFKKKMLSFLYLPIFKIVCSPKCAARKKEENHSFAVYLPGLLFDTILKRHSISGLPQLRVIKSKCKKSCNPKARCRVFVL